MNSKTKRSFFAKYEFIIPLALFILFLIFTLPGISWGAPDTWHPDEIVVRSIKALHGEWQFSETNFDYPDLPQYAMFWLGKVVLALGKTDKEVLIASRVLSAVLAGLTIVLTYIIVRRISGNTYIAGLSGLLLICVSEMSHNGRFAHNDTYITFFVALAILFLVNYKISNLDGWLYASFIAVGMAASSKYNGISLVIAPALVYIVPRRRVLFNLRTLETLFIGGILTFLGFAFGTPKALTWMTFYFKRMIPALLRTGNYFRQPDSVRGYIGQYASFAQGVGFPLFILFTAALIWACYKTYQAYVIKREQRDTQTDFLVILLLALLALDLPVMVSYNYPIRFFLPLMPLFAVISALFIAELYQRNTQYQKVLGVVLSVIVLFSFARNVSVMLLFQNDSRIPAGAFLETLPLGTSLEETYYPPSIPAGHFSREHNYPIYFQKNGEPLPTNKNYVYNVGEIGLDQRQTDYLVTDSFTWKKFNDPYVCSATQVECDFFKQLAAGHSNHYKLLKEFSYTLPPYLPQIDIAFVNPSIRIYERIK
jgi:4-amino-4-deoxy-L-arabinose transferase-like glycosyltransferase